MNKILQSLAFVVACAVASNALAADVVAENISIETSNQYAPNVLENILWDLQVELCQETQKESDRDCESIIKNKTEEFKKSLEENLHLINEKDAVGATLLIKAAELHSYEIMELLIHAGANLEDAVSLKEVLAHFGFDGVGLEVLADIIDQFQEELGHAYLDLRSLAGKSEMTALDIMQVVYLMVKFGEVVVIDGFEIERSPMHRYFTQERYEQCVALLSR